MIFCTRTLRCAFTVGAMKNSRMSSPRKIVSCFAMVVCSVMEVLGHEHNPDQWRLFTDSSKVNLKLVLLHNGTNSPPSLWLMQPTWRKVMKAWSYYWERLSMTNLSGSYVVISRFRHCHSECNSGTQNTAVSCASGTAGTRRITG